MFFCINKQDNLVFLYNERIKPMRIIGIKTEGLGTNNQMRGVVISAAQTSNKGNKVPVSREELLTAADGTILHPKNFDNMEMFQKAVQASVRDYLSQNSAPDFVVLPIDHAMGTGENKDVDALAKTVKEEFSSLGHDVKTLVLASNLYDYQNVDLVHVGKHLLSAEDEKTLKSNPKLKAKVVETLGVPSNISWQSIRNLAHQPVAEKVLAKYRPTEKEAAAKSEKGIKTALFSLGGMTDNGAIGFDLKDADSLFKSALKLKSKGYKVIFTNSPRTPSDVTDYLYEKCQAFHMEFFNSKKVAQNEEEAGNFRNYSGKYKAEFTKQAKEVGNIYPAVLDVCDFVVNTHDSFSYTSDAAALGIPSVVYTGNFIDKEKRPDCYKLFDLCNKDGYAIALDEALDKIGRGESLQTKKMDDVSTQLVKAMAKSLSNERENGKSAQER